MRWIRRLWQKSLSEKRLAAELQFHLDEQIAGYVASGMSREEARRRAHLEFGGVERFKEECRDTHPETHVHTFIYDLRYAWRSLRKDLRFSLLVVSALTLGIGCSTAIFSIVYNGVLHPFPYRAADRLAALGLRDLADPRDKGRKMFTLAEIRAFRESNHTMEDIAGWSNWWVLYSTGKGTERLHGCRVTPNAFQFFGVQPVVGRLITPEDAKPGAPPVVAISYKLWKLMFHGDSHVVGTKMVLDQNLVTIVAVMPRRFTADGADLWSPTPLSGEPGEAQQHRFDNEPSYFFATGILKKGVTRQAAAADLEVILKQVAAANPEDEYPKQVSMTAEFLSDAVVSDFKAVLYFLCAAVGMLMLISCSNVANLLLTRSTAREREIALRASIGASRSRLIRQLLTEALVLAGAGCLCGCLLAYAGLKAMLTQLPSRIPSEADISLNLPVLGFALLVSIATVFLCGLSPALHSVRGNYRSKLIGIGAVATSLRQARLRSALVIGEIALAMVLLVCAGLTLRSFLALNRAQVGYDPSRVLAASLNFPKGRYVTAAEKRPYFTEILRRVSAMPGVTVAATTITVPTEDGGGSRLTFPGREEPPGKGWGTALDLCSEDIFRVLDIRLLSGRLLNAKDIAEGRHVAVVNRTFTRLFYSGQDPLGQRFKLNAFDQIPDSPRDAYFEIVGVISDVENRSLKEPVQQVYLPYTVTGFADRWLLLRTSVEPESLVAELREQVWSVDREVAVSGAEALNSVLTRAYMAGRQFSLFAMISFAAIGLLLVVTGVSGLMAYTVSLQRHEIGIRMALGAQPDSILRMVLGKGLRLILVGLLIGLADGLGVAFLLRHQFFELSPADPLTYSAGCAILVTVGLLACWVPARRATRVDPMTALRYE